ncbi:MAG: hypothetical protein WD850_01075 [Candidatus Spechtbacterales bacterium]
MSAAPEPVVTAEVVEGEVGEEGEVAVAAVGVAAVLGVAVVLFGRRYS